MELSQQGFDFIVSHEAVKLRVYLDSKGVPTIGIGHTGPDVTMADYQAHKSITMDQAYALFRSDLERFVGYVNQYVRIQLQQNQFDAMVSFCFNCGPTNLANSTLLKMLNAGNFAGAASEFPRWNRSGGAVVDGLINRRAAEVDMFVHGIYR